ncbi:MAG: sensor histidine kinase [Lachnospiraceae bacterium]
MAKRRDIRYIFLFLALILVLLIGLSLLPSPETVQLSDADNGYDLREYNFENTVYITAKCWESWPEKLYTPDQLEEAEASVPQQSLDYTSVQYVTHRLQLILPKGEIYGIALYSSNYSMRLYIDGVEVDTVGLPGTTREDTAAQKRDGVYYFLPQNETTEIVVQASNFVRNNGCQAPVLTIGEADSITQFTRSESLKSGLVFGCLMSVCLYHLAIFLMNRQRRASLIFSGLCLLLAYLSKDFPALLFPAYNWQIAIRLEYIACVLAGVALMLLVNNLFPRTLHKWIVRIYLALCGVYITIVIFTDSTFFSRMLLLFEIASIATLAYGVVRLAMTLRKKKIKNLLAFLGIVIFGLLIVSDLLLGGRMFINIHTRSVSIGMMFFAFCYALVLSLEMAETNQRLDKISISETELRETNEMLMRLDRTKAAFLGNISHEMKTPLAVMSIGAGRTLRQIKRNAVNEETEKNLDTIQQEAVRLGRLVEQLIAISFEKERRLTLTRTDAMTLMQKAADFSKPICEGMGNDISVRVQPEVIALTVNADSLLQVFINLIANANKHTKNDTIQLSAERNDQQDLVVFRVSDQGEGIDQGFLDSIWKPGVSGDGGTGLGLSICKEIIEEHGGEITVSSENGGGTSICFTLPAQREEIING